PQTGLLRCARNDARNRVLAARLCARATARHFRKSSPPGIAARRTASFRRLCRWSMLTLRAQTPVGALCQRNFRMDCRVKLGNDERKDERERTNERKKIRGETPTDARLFCRGIGHGRASQRRGAHLSAFHRGSRPKESLIARDSASGQASWDVAGHVFRILFTGVTRARLSLTPTCPTPPRPPPPRLST